jgi:hypothetical protein
MVKALQGQRTALAFELEYLRKEKDKLEGTITTDKFLLEQTLTQALINLKLQRPDLFTLPSPEQIAMPLKVILK